MSIPQEFSIQSLPISFRYYDPLFAIIKALIPQDTIEYLNLKNKLGHVFEEDENLIKEAKDYVESKARLSSFENPLKQIQKSFGINHMDSPYIMDL